MSFNCTTQRYRIHSLIKYISEIRISNCYQFFSTSTPSAIVKILIAFIIYTYAKPIHNRWCVFLQVWFSNRRARLRKQMSSNTGSSTPGSGGYGMGLALGYSPSAQQQQNQQQQSSGPNSSSTPAYIMSPQQLHEPYNTTPDGYKGMK